MSGAHCSPHPIAKEEASGLLVGKHLCHSQRSQRSPRGVFFSLLCCVQLRWMVVHPLDCNFWKNAAGVRRAARRLRSGHWQTPLTAQAPPVSSTLAWGATLLGPGGRREVRAEGHVQWFLLNSLGGSYDPHNPSPLNVTSVFTCSEDVFIDLGLVSSYPLRIRGSRPPRFLNRGAIDILGKMIFFFVRGWGWAEELSCSLYNV